MEKRAVALPDDAGYAGVPSRVGPVALLVLSFGGESRIRPESEERR